MPQLGATERGFGGESGPDTDLSSWGEATLGGGDVPLITQGGH